MAMTMRSSLDAVERQPLKCGLRRTTETFVRGGQLFEKARERCGYSKEEAASHYGVTPSLLTRQTTNQDNQHLSFQRICEMPAAFQRELALRMLAGLGVRMRMVVEVDEEAA